jgi:hypothetical protein
VRQKSPGSEQMLKEKLTGNSINHILNEALAAKLHLINAALAANLYLINAALLQNSTKSTQLCCKTLPN